MSNKRNKRATVNQAVEIIERTDTFFDKYCSHVFKGKSEDENFILWQGEIDGGRIVQAKLFKGLAAFMIGMDKGSMLFTDEVLKQHSKMIEDFEKIILLTTALSSNKVGQA